MPQTLPPTTDKDRYDMKDANYDTYPNVRTNPINRSTYFGTHHHMYSDQDLHEYLQDRLVDIQSKYADHALVIGGDQIYSDNDKVYKRLKHIVVMHTGESFIAAVERNPHYTTPEFTHLATEDAVLSYLDDIFIPNIETTHESYVGCGLASLDQTTFMRMNEPTKSEDTTEHPTESKSAQNCVGIATKSKTTVSNYIYRCEKTLNTIISV